MTDTGASSQRIASSSSKKRRAPTDPEVGVVEDQDAPPKKLAKLAPIFATPAEKNAKPEMLPGVFRWLKPMGAKRTCLFGLHLDPLASVTAPASVRIAAFDLDGTLIVSPFDKTKGKAKRKGGGGALSGSGGFEWWKDVVPKKLEEVKEQGYVIALISNQKVTGKNMDKFKERLPLITRKIPKIPFFAFAATAADEFRKPMPGMWLGLERLLSTRGLSIDKEDSFFVGDAAGRADDFASTDRKLALNIGIPFYTPERYFLNSGPTEAELPPLTGFRPPSASEQPASEAERVSEAELPITRTDQEVVIFVGPPCVGKSTFYRTRFKDAGYVHINQDTLKTRPKCLKATEEALEKGLSCVVDNTNRDAATRKNYTALAKKAGVPIRCFVFDASTELAWHNNLYRAFIEPTLNSGSRKAAEATRDLVPYIAFTGFQSAYEAPQLDEGFVEMRIVRWRFEGGAVERKAWEMWLQISGK
ncbi:PNK3P-domain-containing protein [Peniophora sp. CONT]|nr:PNK3P-domain-containing protein [Peniophora sp. CONT]